MSRTLGRAAVALAMTALLVAACSPGSDGTATQRPGDLLRPGAELNGMRLTTATERDADIWSSCDPIVLQPETHTRECEVPQLQRLKIGHGHISSSPELLEEEWQAERWELYLDGRQVDLIAFGTLPDFHYFETKVGAEIWVRVWAVAIVNPTPGQHTLRYVVEQSPAGEETAGTSETTWTFTVTPKPTP
jgi:hypothetical protein